MTLGNDNGTDGQTDRQTDGQTERRNMRPPPREEGRITRLRERSTADRQTDRPIVSVYTLIQLNLNYTTV